jgi:iron complex transport system substrate-binding protein
MTTMRQRPQTGLKIPPGLPAKIDNDLTRRGFLVGAGGLLVLAAGCGNGGAVDDDGQASAATRTVEHKYGTTEIRGTPQRSVTVGFSDQDYVLAVGLAPVAVTDWYGDYPYATWPWAQDELGNATPEVLNKGQFTGDTTPNFEAIAALNPDLITAWYSGLSQDQYDKLSQIAPTVAQSKRYPDYGMPWQAATREAGHAAGRTERAEQLIAEVEARFAQARAGHPEFEGKTAVVAERFEPGKFFVRAPQDPRSQFLISLGFEIPEQIAELAGDLDGAEISEEQLNLLDHDLLLWNVGFSPELATELADNRLYQQLDVAREDRAVFLEDEVLSGALTWGTVLSLPFAIDGLVPMLAAAVDGDPATKVRPG